MFPVQGYHLTSIGVGIMAGKSPLFCTDNPLFHTAMSQFNTCPISLCLTKRHVLPHIVTLTENWPTV